VSRSSPLAPPIRAIFFDAVGTLLHPEPAAPEVYAEVGRRHGSRIDVDLIATRFRQAFLLEEECDRRNAWRTSEAREIERWRHIVAAVLDDIRDAEACFQELFDHFSRPGSWRCDPDTEAVLRELSGRGYELGMASNYDHRLRTVVAGLPALAPIGRLVISAEVGWRKPAVGFFNAVCQPAGWSGEQLLYVGDDPANDYDGARAAGVNAVLLDPDNRAASVAGSRIRRLLDLLG
jgi:putative hydrolase of the HAD superfamily